MIKKVFVGVLLAGIFGLLVFGAINRTIAKSADAEQLSKNQDLNQSQNQSLNQSQNLNQGNGIGNGGEGQGLNQNENAGEGLGDCEEIGAGNREGRGNSQSSGNNGSGGTGYAGGNNSRENVGQGQGGPSEEATKDGTQTGIADISAWEEPIRVTVESVTEELWLVSNVEGFELEIEGRTLSYLVENGFVVDVGDELTLSGFYEGEDFEVGRVVNESTGLSLDIREASGRPLWAGGGRGGN
jgi:hypothetical protein